jgi:hypothetical protein
LNFSSVKPIHPKPVEAFNIYDRNVSNVYSLEDYIKELDNDKTQLDGDVAPVEQPSPEKEPLSLEGNVTITGVKLPEMFKPRFADQLFMPGLRLEFKKVEQFAIPIVTSNYHKFIRDMIESSIMYSGIPTITIKMVAAKMSAARFRIWVSDKKDSKFAIRTHVNELYAKNRLVKITPWFPRPRNFYPSTVYNRPQDNDGYQEAEYYLHIKCVTETSVDVGTPVQLLIDYDYRSFNFMGERFSAIQPLFVAPPTAQGDFPRAIKILNKP